MKLKSWRMTWYFKARNIQYSGDLMKRNVLFTMINQSYPAHTTKECQFVMWLRKWWHLKLAKGEGRKKRNRQNLSSRRGKLNKRKQDSAAWKGKYWEFDRSGRPKVRRVVLAMGGLKHLLHKMRLKLNMEIYNDFRKMRVCLAKMSVEQCKIFTGSEVVAVVTVQI